MNILHVINNLERGGAESMLIKLVNHNSKDNITIFNLIGKNSYEIINNKVKVINFKFKTFNILKIIFNLIKLLYCTYIYKPDKIIFWLYHSFIFSIFLKIFYLKKVDHYWNIRQVVPDFKYEKKTTKFIFIICKLFSFIPTSIIYNSEESRKSHFIKGFNNKKSIYIPNGFVESSRKGIIPSEITAQLKNKFVIGLFARYHLSKGHNIFLKSISLINNDNIIYLLAGKNVNYKNKKITEIIKIEKINKNVILLDEIYNVEDYLQHVDLLVNCSTASEGFPNIIGEAIMNNCLCIASDISDNKKILLNDNLIIKNINKDTLSKKIMEIYKLSPDSIKEQKSKLKHNFITKYSIDKIAKMYDSI